MKDRRPLVPASTLSEAIAAALAALDEFNPKKTAFLDKTGNWEDTPRTLRDRFSHAFFYDLKARAAEEAAGLLQAVFAPFLEDDSWPEAAALGNVLLQPASQGGLPEPEEIEGASCRSAESSVSSSSPSAFLLLHENLLRVIWKEILRLNTESPASEWDIERRAYKAACRKQFGALEEQERVVLGEAGRKKFAGAADRVRKEALIEGIAVPLAEEVRVSDSLETLLAAAADRSRKEEVYAAVSEKIQPPMGIVTNIPPAMFFPCLRLLGDPRLDVSSGIPYMASIILSVFQDPRSADTLLRGLERLPLGRTKIRENLIYTLGNLGEGRAVDFLIDVLNAPDEIVDLTDGRETPCLLLEQKEEAIWALGKIGLPSVRAIPALANTADHPSARLKTYLAWTLGEIGQAQKESSGGVSADVVIALLKLLKEKNKQTFEEAVGGLEKIDMPEFVHALYLYHVGAISILGLKPAQRGLYELSETIHYLLRTKQRAVIAVNGDSGTGKTYFCQAIAGGFAGIQAGEILYLMRDAKKGQKVFNRLLGLPWLKKHIDPSYYHDYPVSEEVDDPDSYFRRFLEDNRDKRLIILDGCRDRHYFQKVIDFFYNQGELDVEVNFRANFSTRRLNLESREFALESVKLHLAFLEEPALEDTSFYQEGLVILYDLDNSRGARLNSQETRELFGERRIDSWGELIRIGGFAGREHPLSCRKEGLRSSEADFDLSEEDWPEFEPKPFIPMEMKLSPVLNKDLKAEPNLLKTIPLDELCPGRIRFYAQDQIAGIGDRGLIFVLTFLDNRLFSAAVDGISDFALLGRTFFLAAPGKGFFSLSFERNEITSVHSVAAAPLRLAAFPPDRVVSAHADGTIRIWDFLEKKIWAFDGGRATLFSLALDQSGRVCAGYEDGKLSRWDLETRKVIWVESMAAALRFIRTYPGGKILAAEQSAAPVSAPILRMIDFAAGTMATIPTEFSGLLSGINVYFDGRIIAALGSTEARGGPAAGSLAVISPREQGCAFTTLSGHGHNTKDCLTMGPKIVTCGEEEPGRSSVRIWGSEFYVRTELGKLLIKPR
jgi:hypothetical protein